MRSPIGDKFYDRTSTRRKSELPDSIYHSQSFALRSGVNPLCRNKNPARKISRMSIGPLITLSYYRSYSCRERIYICTANTSGQGTTHVLQEHRRRITWRNVVFDTEESDTSRPAAMIHQLDEPGGEEPKRI